MVKKIVFIQFDDQFIHKTINNQNYILFNRHLTIEYSDNVFIVSDKDRQYAILQNITVTGFRQNPQ